MHGWDINVVVSFNAHFQCMGLHHKKGKEMIFAKIKMGKRKNGRKHGRCKTASICKHTGLSNR
jgi:hypothetical protein